VERVEVKGEIRAVVEVLGDRDGGGGRKRDAGAGGGHWDCPITGRDSNCLVRNIRPTSGRQSIAALNTERTGHRVMTCGR
jgi:hypothetical protein